VQAGLVCAQVAVAAVLLTTGGLLLESYAALTRTDPGFDAAGLHTLEYRLPANKYGPAAQVQFHSEVVERVSALPGVRGAALVRALPFSGNGDVTAFRTDRTPAHADPATTELNTVTDDYFRLLNIPLLQGRTFDSRDSATAPIAVVVSRSLAAREWPNDSPIGRILMPVGTEIRAQVIGVVDDVRHRDLRDDELATCYVRQVQNPGIFMTLVAKVDGDPAVIAPAIRRAVWAVDPDQPVWKERSLASLVDRSLQGDRFLSSVLVVFAAAGLLLVAAGVYGVVSQSVARRAREIGVRMALGARRGTVVAGIMRSGLKLTIAGAAAGLGLSLWVHRLMLGLLHQASSPDAVPYGAAAAILIALALAACYGPARRAAGIDPATALRASD
jgi:predicted permease